MWMDMDNITDWKPISDEEVILLMTNVLLKKKFYLKSKIKRMTELD